MNIDVKNALDRVLSACEKIKSISTKDKGFRLITEYVVEDIYDFINAISLTGAEERFQYFDVVYLNGAFSDHAFGDNQGGIPKSLPLFCQVDCEVMKEKGVKIATLFVALLTELGKSYLLSKHDKKAIDAKAFSDYIHRLSSYVSEQECQNKLPQKTASGHGMTHDNGIMEATDSTGTAIAEDDVAETEPVETLEELLEQLNNLIGLSGVKQELPSIAVLFDFISGVAHPQGEIFPYSIVHNAAPICVPTLSLAWVAFFRLGYLFSFLTLARAVPVASSACAYWERNSRSRMVSCFPPACFRRR